MADRKARLKSKFYSRFNCLLLFWLLLAGGPVLRAAPVPDLTTPLNFFTNTANLFLQNAGYNFTVSNIPIYPTNYYTPALHRLLQLAANLYDASTNRAFSDGASPNGPFYPSVFRPAFNVSGGNVFIAGYVEVGDGATDYQAIPLSLPEDFALVTASTTNIYGIPWVIGARKGFPNFNEFSMQSVSQITRKVQLVKQNQYDPASLWTTNIQYSLSISNVLGVEAWNSYSNAYSRSVDIIGVDNLSLYLTNELGVLVVTNLLPPTAGLPFVLSIAPNQWAGFNALSKSNVNAPSFLIPLLTNVILMPNLVYHPTQPPYLNNNISFDAGLGYIQPLFGLNITNRLRFIMVDHATGRVIDYVHFNGMNVHRDLTGELMGPDNGGEGGVWDTNRLGAAPDSSIVGVKNQIAVSLGITNIPGYLPLLPADWTRDQLQPISRAFAISTFQNFYNGNTTNLIMQVPFTPTRKVSVYYTWQANDPLVHYILSDLMSSSVQFSVQTNWPAVNSNFVTLPNIGQINIRYLPWGNFGNLNAISADRINIYNLAVKDPLITRSDAWNFPTGQPLNFSSLGNVHRGTPWQTFYLKSTPVSATNWQSWTGNSNPHDALLSQPTNDWSLAVALLPWLTPQDPHYLFSVNPTDPNAWASVFQGLTVITNTPTGDAPLVIDATLNSNAILQIVSGISALKAAQPGQVFTNLTPILAVPQLSVASPFLDTTGTATNFLTDAAYESLPAQLLPLLRPDSIGSVVNARSPTQYQFTGFDGYAYIVQASTNLSDWTPVATLYPENGAFLFSDRNAANSPRRYYRTVLAP